MTAQPERVSWNIAEHSAQTMRVPIESPCAAIVRVRQGRLTGQRIGCVIAREPDL
jgi:hypothetical protein